MPGVCPRCSRNVYFAEEKLALGKVWHILCFSCRNCRKLLDSCSVVTHEDDLFCKKCCPKPTISVRQQQILQDNKDKSCCRCHSRESLVDGSEWKNKFDDIEIKKISDGQVTDCNSQCSITSSKPQLYQSQNSNHSRRFDSSTDNLESSEEPKKIKNTSRNLTSLDSPRLNPENHNEGSSVCLKNLPNCRRVSFQYKEQEEEQEEEEEEEEEEIMEKDEDNDNSLILIDESVEINEKRLRGGSGCCCSRDNHIYHSNTDTGCCKKSHHGDGDSGRSSCRTHNKTHEESSCGSGSQGCGSGGSCGGGCRGNCGKPGQSCLPSRTCTTPISSSRRTPQYPPVILESSRCRGQRNSSRSPCTAKGRRQAQDDDQGGGYRSKTPVGCECLGGGGLDCQRCGRKVYHAEMHFASGVPYHSICFSCHCCRKPLETLTYHENCGEIYCKQCYVRNFGPQGYGYSGVLQTPM